MRAPDSRPTPAASGFRAWRASRLDVHVGARLRVCRLETGVGVSALCREVGIEIERLLGAEAGLVRLTGLEICALAEALGFELSSLFDGLR